MFQYTTQQKIHYTLRVATAMCFIGHCAFGIITKAIWCNYFAVFGIGHDMAYRLMPVIGTADILMGLTFLFYPVRIIAGWLVIWGIVTASLRPASGEPFAELIERAGNFGAPLALLLLSGGMVSNIKDWFKPINPSTNASEKTMANVRLCLRIVVVLLLAGHGWLNLIEKKGLLAQYTGLGFANPAATAHFVGTLEILAACTVLIKPVRWVLIVFLAWKAGSELFYPRYEILEWVERGGSYGTLLALWLSLKGASVSLSRATLAV